MLCQIITQAHALAQHARDILESITWTKETLYIVEHLMSHKKLKISIFTSKT